MVILKFGITDNGNKLKPIYGRVQPAFNHSSFKILFSSATILALLSESRPAIGNSNFAIKSELSGLKIGNSIYGYWFFKPGFFSYGDTYRNYMGDNQSNHYGYWINSYYLVPKRAITFTINYSACFYL